MPKQTIDQILDRSKAKCKKLIEQLREEQERKAREKAQLEKEPVLKKAV